jgi:periplasmic protein TonB
MRQHPKVDLRAKSKKVLELCVMASLLAHLAVFLIWPKFEYVAQASDSQVMQIQVEDIPPTQQVKRPPPPARPSIPIESEDETLDDDVTIESTEEMDFTDIPPPPPPPEEEEEVIPPFLPLEDQPKLLGESLGAQLKSLIKYPEMARKAGIQGQVFVRALIGKDGSVEATEIVKGMPNTGCDEEAVRAVLQLKFAPAKQRGKPVRFWFSVPITFSLN